MVLRTRPSRRIGALTGGNRIKKGPDACLPLLALAPT